MARRRRSHKREVTPDSRYGDRTLARFMNKIMERGKKAAAERIVYGALEVIATETGKEALQLFHTAMENMQPGVEVRSRRIGGATYQVPVEVRRERAQALAMRWMISCSRARSEKSMALRLARELMEAAEKRGAAIKKREDTHRMAEANRAFAHYRW